MDHDGAEYAVARHRRGHRIGSLVFALLIGGAILAFAKDVRGARSIALLVFPLAAIWFADELGDFTAMSGGWLTCRQQTQALRWGDWFCLVAFAFLVVVPFFVG